MSLRTSYRFLLAALLTAGCAVFEEPAPEQVEAGKRYALTLSLAETATTKADWTDPDDREEGHSYDNHIGSLQILLCQGTRIVARLTDLQRIDGSIDSDIYENPVSSLSGRLSTSITAGSYTLMVLANAPDASACTTTADLEALRYRFYDTDGHYLVDGTVSNVPALIPMWGATQVTLAAVAGSLENLGHVQLLRALAKVTVVLGETLTGQSIDYVAFWDNATTPYTNTTGTLLPHGWNTRTKTELLDQEDVYNVDETGKFVVKPTFTRSTDLTSATIYIPELDIADATVPVRRIEVRLRGETASRYFDPHTPVTGTILEHYVRNHHYVMVVDQSGESTSLDLHLKVLPWNVHSEYMTWTERPADNTAFLWDETTVQTTDDPAQRIISADTVAECSFTLDPDLVAEGGFWYASFEYTGGQYGTFQFRSGESGAYTYSTSVTGNLSTSAQHLSIRINPDVPAVDTQAVLRIVVKNGYSVTRVQYLMISGNRGEYTVVRKI